MALNLDGAARARILDFVRPMAVGLDGMTNFGSVDRRQAVVRRLLDETSRESPPPRVDEGRLFLLTVFAGLPDRRLVPGGRTGLLLQSAGVPAAEVAVLLRSLKRFESAPRGIEEELVHDSMLLETVGAYGVTQALVAGARERMTLAEMADDIEAKMSAARFVTAAARRIATSRTEMAREFARRLKEEVAEFGPEAVS